MRKFIMTVGDYDVEEEVYNSGFIGGRFIAFNKVTDDKIIMPYKNYHDGSSTRLEVFVQLGKKLKETIKNEGTGGET